MKAAQTPDGPKRSRRSEHPDLPAEKAHLAGVVAAIDKRIVELDVPRPKVKNWALHSAWRLKIASRDRLEKARPEPYFGRVDFAPADHGETESHRIGRFAAPGVTDWRAPVASLMYSRAQGGVDTYTSPDGDVTGQVSLRRHYRIERAELQEIFDARVEDRILSALAGEQSGDDAADRSDDPYLVARLSQSASAAMRDIVATIQAEQNDVLRAPLGKIVVLQGVAGSGKTSVALHRVAYLMYAYPDAVSPQDTLVLAPNRLFLQYVADLLPSSLGVSGVRQLSLGDWLLQLIGVRAGAPLAAGPLECPAIASWVRSADAVGALRAWCAREGVRPSGGVQGPLLEPALRLWTSYLRAWGADATQAQAQAQAQAAAWAARLERGAVHEADLASLCYIAERIGPWVGRRRYDHIVVDEAQDLTPLHCAVLGSRSRQTSLTLVGDLAQCLAGGTPQSWDEVLGRVFGRAQIARYNLVRNYRSTRQIVSLAQEVLRRAATGLTAPEPVARDGPPVQMHACSDSADAVRCIERVARDLANRHGSVAVIAPDDVTARRLASTLGAEDLSFELHVGARARRLGARVVLPLEMARGLEFDAVLVVEADAGRYPAGQVSGRRLYTAVTRALHELAVVWWGQRSPLLPQD